MPGRLHGDRYQSVVVLKVGRVDVIYLLNGSYSKIFRSVIYNDGMHIVAFQNLVRFKADLERHVIIDFVEGKCNVLKKFVHGTVLTKWKKMTRPNHCLYEVPTAYLVKSFRR